MITKTKRYKVEDHIDQQEFDIALEKYKQHIDKKRAIGRIGWKQIGNSIDIDLSQVSHLIKNIEKVDDEYIFTIDILDTGYGKILEDMPWENLEIRTRGIGNTQDGKWKNIEITEFVLKPKYE